MSDISGLVQSVANNTVGTITSLSHKQTERQPKLVKASELVC